MLSFGDEHFESSCRHVCCHRNQPKNMSVKLDFTFKFISIFLDELICQIYCKGLKCEYRVCSRSLRCSVSSYYVLSQLT